MIIRNPVKIGEWGRKVLFGKKKTIEQRAIQAKIQAQSMHLYVHTETYMLQGLK